MKVTYANATVSVCSRTYSAVMEYDWRYVLVG